ITCLGGSAGTSAALTRRCSPLVTSVTTTAARHPARSAFSALRISSLMMLSPQSRCVPLRPATPADLPRKGGRCIESAAGALLRTSVPPTRLLHLLHIDADGAATGKPDLPGRLHGHAEFERLRPS